MQENALCTYADIGDLSYYYENGARGYLHLATQICNVIFFAFLVSEVVLSCWICMPQWSL